MKHEGRKTPPDASRSRRRVSEAGAEPGRRRVPAAGEARRGAPAGGGGQTSYGRGGGIVTPQRFSLASQAVDALRELVLTGEIPPGSRVNEVLVAQRLGISRGPLREAIRHLASEGLLVLSPNRGAVVPAPGADEVRALFELRTALECAAAGLAAERRTGADVERLREVCAASRGTHEKAGPFPYRLDIAFHTALLETARSPRIAEQVTLVQQQVILLRTQVPDDPAHTRASLDDHDALTEAVAAADGALAVAAMRKHLDRVRDQMLARV